MLYLRIVCVRSAVSIDPSLTRVVPDLFVSLYVSKSCSCSSSSSSFDGIYRSVSLSFLTGYFPLSLHVVPDPVRVLLLPPSTVSIDPSLYRVVPDLFVFLALCLVLRSIVPDLFLSLYVLFFVRPYL